MPDLRKRLMLGAVIFISLIVAATMLRLALEWRQAFEDINSMIVTPAVITYPTDVAASPQTDSQLSTDAPDAQANAAVQPAVPADVSQSDLSLQQESLNILLLGTDARPDEKIPTRTDALVLVRVARDGQRVSMLSMPRDLWVKYPSGGEGRINAAYAVGEKRFGPGGGAALAKATVGKLLGLQVDHFVLINFEGFRTLIDELGGIKIDVPQAISDPAYPTDDYNTISVSFKEGPQFMNGERALIYARTRHADSDFGRNQRQQLVLMAIFDRIRERGLLQQLTSLDDYTGALRGYIQTDLNRGRMIELANFARGINPDSVLRYAIDNKSVVDLKQPATFAAEPDALRRIVAQFTGDAFSSAGGE